MLIFYGNNYKCIDFNCNVVIIKKSSLKLYWKATLVILHVRHMEALATAGWWDKVRHSLPSKAVCGSQLPKQGASTTSTSCNRQDKRRQEREPRLHNIPEPSGTATTTTVSSKDHRRMPAAFAAAFKGSHSAEEHTGSSWSCALS